MQHYLVYAIPVIVIIWGIVVFNSLTELRKRCVSQRAAIDIELKRRHDLIPSLVDTVKAFSFHESETISDLARQRSEALESCGGEDSPAAEERLEGTLKTLFAVVEDHPELKADHAYLELQQELVVSEDRIRFARQFYNDIVMRYNTNVSTFPAIVIARLFHFDDMVFFSSD